MVYDKDIREPLFDFLEMIYGKIRIIEEKQIVSLFFHFPNLKLFNRNDEKRQWKFGINLKGR